MVVKLKGVKIQGVGVKWVGGGGGDRYELLCQK